MKRLVFSIVTASLLSPQLWAYDTKFSGTGKELPAELQGVEVQEKLGAQIDLNTTFTDETGAVVPLSKYFLSDRPVLMAMVYYTCPSLCNFHLNGLTDAMKKIKWTSGKDFEVVAVSMNSEEGPEVAGAKKLNYLKLYDRHIGDSGWHFLVGNKVNVKKLADQLGFNFRYMPETKQFAHASVAYVVTPEGKISRYLHGILVEPDTLKYSLLEASHGKIGTVLEHALMFCIQYDPHKSKYTLAAWNIMRIGAILMTLLIAIVLISTWWRGQHNFKSSDLKESDSHV